MILYEKKITLSDDDQKIINMLNPPKHVVHALKMILSAELRYDKSDIKSIKDIINNSLVQRSELYYKFNF
jgi:hypothetical protein